MVVTEETSPFAFTAFMLIVPVGRTTMSSLSSTFNQSSSGPRLARHRSHRCRDSSVSRFSSRKPYERANRFAPSPTSMM